MDMLILCVGAINGVFIPTANDDVDQGTLHDEKVRVVDVQRDALKEIMDSLILRVDAVNEVFIPTADDDLEGK